MHGVTQGFPPLMEHSLAQICTFSHTSDSLLKNTGSQNQNRNETKRKERHQRHIF